MKKFAAAKAKQITAVATSAVLAAAVAAAVTTGGGHPPKPTPTAGSSWAGVEHTGLLGSILGGL